MPAVCGSSRWGHSWCRSACKAPGGIVPAHLNELSPEGVRGTFPGFTYQLGNLIASLNFPLQTWIAQKNPLPDGHENYALGLAVIAGGGGAAAAAGHRRAGARSAKAWPLDRWSRFHEGRPGQGQGQGAA